MPPRFLSAPAALAALTVAVAACVPRPAEPDRFTETGRVIAFGGGDAGARKACFRCHGLQGEGDGRSAPWLAGRGAGYLQKQLQDYATGLRPDPVMSPIAQQLDDRDRRAVAAWYASLPKPDAAAAPSAVSALGQQIYVSGAPDRGVQPCAACHGAGGRGQGLAIPSLAGQPASYTAEQLRRWKKGERRNDPRGVMGDISRRLDEQEIDAVSHWLAAQQP